MNPMLARPSQSAGGPPPLLEPPVLPPPVQAPGEEPRTTERSAIWRTGLLAGLLGAACGQAALVAWQTWGTASGAQAPQVRLLESAARRAANPAPAASASNEFPTPQAADFPPPESPRDDDGLSAAADVDSDSAPNPSGDLQQVVFIERSSPVTRPTADQPPGAPRIVPAMDPVLQDPMEAAAAWPLDVEPPGELQCEAAGRNLLGTAVHWTESPDHACQQAREQGKLVFVIHVSGNFEIPGFT